MKKSKTMSLFAISLLLAPTILSFSKTVSADETLLLSDSQQTTSSTESVTNSVETQEEIPAVQETVDSTVPEQEAEVPAPVEPEAGESAPVETNPEGEVSVPSDPEQEVTDPGLPIEEPEASTETTLLENYADEFGNQVIFEKNEGFTAGEVVNFQILTAEGQELTDLSFANTAAFSINEEKTAGTVTLSELKAELIASFSAIVPETPPVVEPEKPTNPGNQGEVAVPKPTPKPTPPISNPVGQPNNSGNNSNSIPSYTISTPIPAILPTNATSVQQAIVEKALQYLGIPYVWGGKSPSGFDCSGFTSYVYRNATGREIGGWTGTQQYAGTQIPVSQAQPGDLLFWGPSNGITHHVAIYIGNGQFVHAPQTGDVIKITNLVDFQPDFAVRIAASGLPGANGELHFQKNQSTDVFLEQIAESAREIGQTEGIYASVMIAQAILESGSGNSSLASAPNYNLFGIKGQHEGQSVSFSTLEQTSSGASYSIQASFRKYPGYKESLEDYAKLIKGGLSGNSDFYKGTWKSETQSYMDATAYLQGRYATDVQYANKLNGIINAYDLTQFDQPKEPELSDEQLQPLAVAMQTLNDDREIRYAGYHFFRKEEVLTNPKLMRLVTPKKLLDNMKQSQSRNSLRPTDRTRTSKKQTLSLSNGYIAIAFDEFTAYLPK